VTARGGSLKIAYLSRGGDVYDRRFLEMLVARAYKPYLISYFGKNVVKVAGVENFHYDPKALFRFRGLRTVRIAQHLRQLLRRLKVDLLHSTWVPDHGFFGALSGFHPTLSMPWGSDLLLKPKESAVARWKAWFTLRQADGITCDCEYIKDRAVEISNCSPDKIVVFPWGIDLNVFRQQPDTSSVRHRLDWETNEILLMTRNFKSVYGIEYFIDALATVLRERPLARAILVGSGPLEEQLRERVTGHGLDGAVYFAGSVDERGMANYLNAADIYVTTSISDGTSCSMLEAMACGLPVVTSDVPSNLEWVKDGVNGYVVHQRDSVLLANRLVKLLADEELRSTMGAHNVRIARERADWDKNFDVLEDIYHNLVTLKSKRSRA